LAETRVALELQEVLCLETKLRHSVKQRHKPQARHHHCLEELPHQLSSKHRTHHLQVCIFVHNLFKPGPLFLDSHPIQLRHLACLVVKLSRDNNLPQVAGFLEVLHSHSSHRDSWVPSLKHSKLNQVVGAVFSEVVAHYSLSSHHNSNPLYLTSQHRAGY
jgi:hypothetical protein